MDGERGVVGEVEAEEEGAGEGAGDTRNTQI